MKREENFKFVRDLKVVLLKRGFYDFMKVK